MLSSAGEGGGDEVSTSELFVVAAGEGDASAFFVVEVFFGDAEGDAEAEASDFFLVVEAASVVVVDFFAVVAPVVDFFAVVDALWVVAVLEVAVVSCL